MKSSLKKFTICALITSLSTAAPASDKTLSSEQSALSWAAVGAGDLGLQLGIAGPSTVGFQPRRDPSSNNSFGYLPADGFDVEVRNVGRTPIRLCGVQPTFTIKVTNLLGVDVAVLAGLGPAGMSMGPKIYSETIASGTTWSPRYRVPLEVADETTPAGDYVVRARMEALICNPDQDHLRGITLYSGNINVALTKSTLP